MIVDRSAAWEHVVCPLRHKLSKTRRPDADLDAPMDTGAAYHALMEQCLDEWIEGQDRHPLAENLMALATAAPPRFQPTILKLAETTGHRLNRLWRMSYIGHEIQYARRLERAGPHGEDVLMTCCLDYLAYDGEPDCYLCLDWKSGWSDIGEDFQAMFYATVLAGAIEGARQITWQPFYARRGRFGTRYTFYAQPEGWQIGYDQAHAVVMQATMDLLTDTDFAPRPGIARCRMCPHVARCDADRVYHEIDGDPAAFVAASAKLDAELEQRTIAAKAYVEANGNIDLGDGTEWGYDPIASRRTYKVLTIGDQQPDPA